MTTLNRKSESLHQSVIPDGQSIASNYMAVISVWKKKEQKLTLEQALELAKNLHQNGRLTEAETIYTSVLMVAGTDLTN